MIIEIFRILLVTAILGTAVTLIAGVKGGVRGVEIGPRMGLIASTAVFILWGLIAINSFEVTVFSGGQEFTKSYASVAWVAIAGAGISLVSMLQATLQEIDNSGGL